MLRAYLDHALAAAAAARQLLAGVVATDVRSKSNPRDLVTEWDVRAESLLRRTLLQRCPEVGFLGEEGGEVAPPGANQLRWLVDPIDGTVNFAHGLPLWAVSIALEDEHGPAVGVVTAPGLGWTFAGTRGHGAWMERNGERTPLRVSRTEHLEAAMLVTGFPHDRATHPDNNFAEWTHFQRTAGACRRLGSASLDLCLLANGWLDGYWERRLRAWGIAAGVVIVREAGGLVTNTVGGPVDVHQGDLIASNGLIHEAIVRELARVPRPG